MNSIVAGCGNCPLMASEYQQRVDWCAHPKVQGGLRRYIKSDNNYIPITPDWCPLLKEPLTITLKEDNNETT